MLPNRTLFSKVKPNNTEIFYQRVSQNKVFLRVYIKQFGYFQGVTTRYYGFFSWKIVPNNCIFSSRCELIPTKTLKNWLFKETNIFVKIVIGVPLHYIYILTLQSWYTESNIFKCNAKLLVLHWKTAPKFLSTISRTETQSMQWRLILEGLTSFKVCIIKLYDYYLLKINIERKLLTHFSVYWIITLY